MGPWGGGKLGKMNLVREENIYYDSQGADGWSIRGEG